MLIRNYGLFWRRNRINLGRPGTAGHLKGVITKTANPVDFREQQGVYALYDAGFELIYIGQAGGLGNGLFDRLKQHTTDRLAERWSRFSWFGLRRVLANHELSQEILRAHPSLADVLNQIEAILIAVSEPSHNRQGGVFGDADQYLQFFDEENLHPDDREMLKELYDHLLSEN